MLQFRIDELTQKALINEGLVTPEQLTRARDLADKLGGQTTLGDVLLDMNLISGQRLDEFVTRHRNQLSISDILVGRHLVTDNDVLAAREIQRKSAPKSKRIGETLVEMGLLSFVAVTQCAPAILLGLAWPRGTAGERSPACRRGSACGSTR